MKNVVFYHMNCPDGLMAAAVACLALGRDECEFVPSSYERSIDVTSRVKGATVYVLDFSFPPDEVYNLSCLAERVVLIDHHKTSMEQIASWASPDNVRLVLDASRSGAMLAWDHFHPGEPAPLLIQYVDDYDRWVHAMADSKAVHAYLRSLPALVEGFANLLNLGDRLFDVNEDEFMVRTQGHAILRANRQQYEAILGKPEVARFAGIVALAVNSPVHQDDIGEALALKSEGGVGAIWYWRDGRYKVSLRSCKGGVDVSKIAAQYGGGGHAASASFYCVDLPWRVAPTFMEMCLATKSEP